MTTLTRDSSASINLDLARGLAAAMVLLGHIYGLFFLTESELGGRSLAQAPSFLILYGHEAVMVFFVLSGFLVGSSVVRALDQGRWSWREYALNRLTRLYIVLAPALVIGVALDLLGSHFFGTQGIYGGGPKYHGIIPGPVESSISAQIFLGNLFYLQSIVTDTLGSNGPLWSLSVEFWYYVAFPFLWLGLKERVHWLRNLLYFVAALAVLAFIGKHHAIRFAIWLFGLGVALAPPLPWIGSRLGAVLSVLGFGLGTVLVYFILPPATIVGDMLVGLTFAGVVLHVVNVPERKLGRFRTTISTYLSKTSYTTYLVHLPFVVLLHAWLIGPGPLWQPNGVTWLAFALAAASAFLFCFVIWWAFESRTAALRSRFGKRAPQTRT